MIQRICASAHHLPMIADESVHVICTSPPFYSLRKYEGNQDILWPTVEYSPMPGLPPIRVQGCEEGCSHEWVNNLRTVSNNNGLQGSTLTSGAGPEKRQAWHDGKSGTIVGGYCRHCNGWRGALGLEPTIEMYIGHLVLCLREWHRILRADGTCWVNLGDSYFGGKGKSGYELPHEADARRGRGDTMQRSHNVPGYMAARPSDMPQAGLKPKNLMLIPARFALAAQAEGWIVRSDLIWAKPNPMPESVSDRATKSHEYIFMLAKQERYFWDAEAVKEPNQIHPNSGWAKELEAGRNPLRYSPQKSVRNDSASTSLRDANLLSAGRNMRSVLHITTQPTPFAHFATFSERIPEIAILAGTSARGCCPQCGAGWVRITQKPDMSQRPTRSEHAKYAPANTAMNGVYVNNNWKSTHKSAGQAYQDWRNANPDVTTGWQPACECNAGEPVSATVCDPFSGSGTSGKVALRLGRSYIGVDISDSYLTDITDQRLGDGIQMEMAW